MAHRATTLTYVDETRRPLFGLSFVEAGVVLVAYIVAHKILGTAWRGTAALVVPALLWLVLVATHKVRVESYVGQVYGYLTRRALGAPKIAARQHAVIEVDGFTREALTEDEQDSRVINRLQALIASLGAGGAVQLLVTNKPLDGALIVSQIRTRQHTAVGPKAPTAALAALESRKEMRLQRAPLTGNDPRFYLVIYEPARWRSVPLAGLLRRLPGLEGLTDTDDVGLTDLVAAVRAQLANMGLSARDVERIAAVGGTLAGETLTDVGLADGQHAASFYMLMPPGLTDPGFIDALVNMPGAYRLAVWAHGLDADRERTRLAGMQRQNGVAIFAGITKSPTGPSAEQLAAVQETDDMIVRLRRPGEGVVLCGVYVTCFGATPPQARRAARRAKGLMRGVVGATPASGLGHQQPLYVSTLPGVDTARRVWRMHAETAANTFPYNRSNPSTRRGYEIGTTERGELVRLDPADQSLRNALLVIFGLSGMGKTSFTLKLLLLHLLAGGRVTVMDRSGHYGPLCALAKGVTVDTAEALGRVPLDCPMVVVDLRRVETVSSELRAAVDRRVQEPMPDGQHCLVLEEGWQFEYMDAALWLNDLARRGRHWGGFVIYISHDPEDLLNNKILTSMFSSAATKVAFALDDKQGVATALGQAMGLTPKEIRDVKALRMGQCYIMRHNKLRGSIVRGAVQVDQDPDEQWLAVTDPRAWQYHRRAEEIRRRAGDVWGAIRYLADNVPCVDTVDTLEEVAV